MKTSTVLALLLLASAPAAYAQLGSLSYSGSLAPQLSLPTATTATAEITAFAPSWGTLTGVSLSFSGTASRQVKGENLGAGPASYGYTLSSLLSVFSPGGLLMAALPSGTSSGSGTLAAFDGTADFAGASAFNTGLVTTTMPDNHYDVPVEYLAYFTGTDPLVFHASLTGQSTVSGPGSIYLLTTNQAEGQIGVTYTFSPIPEPATYALFTGLLVCGIAVRRRWAAAGGTD